MNATSNRAFPRSRPQRIALALVSGVLLSLAYVYPSLFLLAWIGLVPLLFALRHAQPGESYLLGVVAGLALYVGSTHWAAEFLMALKGYGRTLSLVLASLFWMYSAQAVGIIALAYTWLRRAVPVPSILLLPVIFVTVCIAYPTIFTTRLGETQSQFLPAVQAIEFTGLYGLDFTIVLVNAMLYQWLAADGEPRDRRTASVAAVAVLLWFGYGLYAMNAWKREIATWEPLKVGIVQSNESPSIRIPPPPPGYSRAYPPEMPITTELAAAGAELIIWPETRFKGYFEYDYVRRAFAHEIATRRTPLLFHDQHRVYAGGRLQEYNTAVFLGGDGALAGTYRKVQRIAFGEYVPLVSGIAPLHEWVLSYFGLSEIAPGDGPAVFRTDRFAITPLLCYEIAFPIHVAESLSGRAAGKILVTLSNDTWFGRSRQPLMHASTSALRAVENRVPLVHVLNNGPSLVVAPDGRQLFRGDFQTAAGYLVEMPYSPRHGGSFFSRYPYWFVSALYGALGLLLVSALLPALRMRFASAPRR